MSERWACMDSRPTSFHMSCKIAKTPDDEAALIADGIALVLQHRRYGYRRITTILHQAARS